MRLIALFLIAFSLLADTNARADPSYPTRPITMMVPFAAGGPADFVGRLVAEHMSKTLGQQIVIENSGGAGGTIAAGRVARATADGYMIMVYNQGFAASPALYNKLPYNIDADFRTIGLISRSPMVLIGRRDLPASDGKALAAMLKQQSSQIKFAHAGVGGVAHLCSLVFNTAIGGVEPTLVPYRGGPLAINDIVAGHVDLYCGLWDTYPAIKGNLAKPYIVLGSDRLAAIPDVPTTREAGFADLELYAWYALFAPVATPDAIIARLNEALGKALADPDIRRRFAETGSDIFPIAQQTPAAAATYFSAEMKRLITVLRANNVVPQ
jgi:tripartite-type tricarboxylate transporter receptor subunit TctC